MSECSGYSALDVDFEDLQGLGLAVSTWQTCRHLGAESSGATGRYYPACHHPGGVPREAGAPPR